MRNRKGNFEIDGDKNPQVSIFNLCHPANTCIADSSKHRAKLHFTTSQFYIYDGTSVTHYKNEKHVTYHLCLQLRIS